MKYNLAATLFLFPLLTYAQDTSTPTPPKPAAPNSVYRVAFEIHEPGSVKLRRFSMLLEQGGHGEIRAGARLPVRNDSGVNIVDVGLNIKCDLREQGGKVALRLDIDLTSLDLSVAADRSPGGSLPPVMNQNRAQVDALVTPGQTTSVLTWEAPEPGKNYEVDAVATKIS